MHHTQMQVRQFQLAVPGTQYGLEAVCVACGPDLIVVAGGGSRYHCGAVALTLSLPSLKDPHKLTNSTYQLPVPGHKEEELAREGSRILSRALQRQVVLSVGIHEDQISAELIQAYSEQFYQLIEIIRAAYQDQGV